MIGKGHGALGRLLPSYLGNKEARVEGELVRFSACPIAESGSGKTKALGALHDFVHKLSCDPTLSHLGWGKEAKVHSETTTGCSLKDLLDLCDGCLAWRGGLAVALREPRQALCAIPPGTPCTPATSSPR